MIDLNYRKRKTICYFNQEPIFFCFSSLGPYNIKDPLPAPAM